MQLPKSLYSCCSVRLSYLMRCAYAHIDGYIDRFSIWSSQYFASNDSARDFALDFVLTESEHGCSSQLFSLFTAQNRCLAECLNNAVYQEDRHLCVLFMVHFKEDSCIHNCKGCACFKNCGMALEFFLNRDGPRLKLRFFPHSDISFRTQKINPILILNLLISFLLHLKPC